MSVIVYIDITEELTASHKKTIAFARKYADVKSTELVCVTAGVDDETLLKDIATFGADTIITSSDTKVGFKSIGGLIVSVAETKQADAFVFSNDYTGKWIAPYVSAKLGAAIITGVGNAPETQGADGLKKEIFAGKANAQIETTSEKVVLLVSASNFSADESPKAGNIEAVSAPSEAAPTLIEQQKNSGDAIPLPDAERVVSGGRGLQGPENWGMIEELANNIGAATACSRPVADSDWRPHHEHVGQTGVAIRPNLYIAIGISGAIQHLAGVSGSKVKVVINNDPEAPFFKAADYGIIGDAFEVVPKLNELLKG